jgi:hypothetical protein
MLVPGKIYIGTDLCLPATFKDGCGDLIDPDSVIFRTKSPRGVQASYTYGVNTQVTRDSVGVYSVEINPGEAGRWFYRWETAAPSLGFEGNFIVQASKFFDSSDQGYAL